LVHQFDLQLFHWLTIITKPLKQMKPKYNAAPFPYCASSLQLCQFTATPVYMNTLLRP
jgi:hypothetical protein